MQLAAAQGEQGRGNVRTGSAVAGIGRLCLCGSRTHMTLEQEWYASGVVAP